MPPSPDPSSGPSGAGGRVALILPSGSYRAPDFLAAAADLGVEVVIASDFDQTMAASMGPRALTVDLCDPDAAADRIVERAGAVALDAVVAADDSGVVAAARAGARLGLAHNDPEAVLATRDKARLRAALDAAGVPQPAFRVAPAGADVASLASALGPPVVVKPVSLSASRGVIRADSPPEAVAAAARARRIASDAGAPADEPLLVERFIPGPEVAVEAVVEAGRVRVLAVFDKPDPLDGPFFEETLYVTPSRLPAPDLAAVESTVRAAVAAVGLRTGPVHAELRVREGRAWVIELAARTIGGLCSRAVTLASGVRLEEIVLRNALGLDPARSFRAGGPSGVLMIPIPGAGRLVGVGGQDRARAVPGVRGVEITVPVGGRVSPLPEGDRYLGFVFAAGPDPDAVEASLREALDALEIEIRPEGGPAAEPGGRAPGGERSVGSAR